MIPFLCKCPHQVGDTSAHVISENQTTTSTPFSPLRLDFMSDCLALHKVVSSGDRKTIRGSLRDAQKGFDKVLGQCKDMSWELAYRSKDDGGILARFGGKVKAQRDALMYLERVTTTLETTVKSMTSLVDWWAALLNAAGPLAEAALHVKNITGFQSHARVALGQITSALEFYREAMREPMQSLRAKWIKGPS
ncbi:hypothetical protein EDD15DRAFT_449922 [Pisolithus albus]|nr:hypothetical protein EDD15DRAFT_449922 [Pisolithus albus]